MKFGQEEVVVKTEDGKMNTSLPTGETAVFLVDKTCYVVDVAFGDLSALEKIKGEYRQMPSTK